MPKKKKSFWGWAIFAVAACALLTGIYLLINTTAPMIPRSSDLVKQKLKEKPQIKENRLYIPKIGVEVPIFEGDAGVLDKGAWHRYPDRGDPTKGGNFILSAHRFKLGPTPADTIRQSPFYYIDRVNVGDHFVIDFRGKRYEYTVAEKFRVKPHQIEIEAPSEEAKLTLYSCTLGGSRDGREVFIAKKTDTEE